MEAHRLLANRYEVETLLAEGGMGAVYRGCDRETGQPVAIKMLKPASIAPGMLERFAREGETLRRLNHPNIVKMLAAFEEEGSHYIVMEFVGGGSLRDLLRRERRLSIDRALSIALELSDALARTHHLRIIHRDIKPDNVLLAEDGTPRLTDFGVARAVDAPPSSAGDLVGTYAYLCPEGFQGAALDAKADIWSFGVMLFEMLAGERPFQGEYVGTVMFAILNQALPDLEALRPDAPIALVDLIYRMLNRNPDERIPSMRHVGAELEAILNDYASALPGAGRDTSEVLIAPVQETEPANLLLTTVAEVSTSETPQRHNLPAQTTLFVGRERELAEIERLLADTATRLVTLTGPGGMGKTRLAIEVAARLIDEFPDGVYFVSLAPLDTPDRMLSAIAEALRYTFFQGSEPRRQLAECLMEKRLLLVLDNFEHLAGSAGLIAELLAAARNVKLIATSRERLNLNGETLLNIGGMDFPEWETPQGSAEDAAEYAAVRLFTQSARRVRPDFELTDEHLPHVVRICQQVRGMPLGILLAASWVEVLTPAEIAAEIAQNLDFLESQAYDLPTRQRSLRAVFEYSWTLLNDAEQDALKKLAVFRNGFSREAAQQVTGASLRILMGLVSKSLLRRDPSGRYELHELIRQYAREKLEENGAVCEASCCAHSAYYLDFLAAREDDLFSARSSVVYEEIRREIENVRAAWNYAVATADKRIRRAIATLNQYHAMQKAYVEGEKLFRSVAAAWAETDDRETYARLLAAQGQHAVIANPQQAEAVLKRAIDILRDLAGQGAEVLDALGAAFRSLGHHYDLALNHVEALRALTEALALYRQAGRRYHIGAAALSLAFTLDCVGRFEEAKPLFEEGAAIAHEIDSPNLMLEALEGLSCVARAEGRYGDLLPLIEDWLARLIPKMDDVLRGRALLMLGRRYREMGQYDKAAEHFARAREITQTTGNNILVLILIQELAELYAHIGQFEAARRYADEQYAFARQKKLPDTYKVTSAMLCASLHAHTDDYPTANHFLDEAFAAASDNLALMRFETNLLAGQIALRMKDYDRAETYFRAVEATMPVMADIDRAFNIHNYAEVAYARGDYATTLEYCRAALPVMEAAKRHAEAVRLLVRLGQAQARLGQHAEAWISLRGALERAQRLNVSSLTLCALLGVAVLKAQVGDSAQAEALLSLVVAHPAVCHTQREEAATLLRSLPEGRKDEVHSIAETVDTALSQLLSA